MTTFNLEDLSKALEGTHLQREGTTGVSFEGKNLKLDTADDVQELVEAVNGCNDLQYLNLAGNTLGVEAAKELAQALEKHPEFKRALWKDMFTGRLKEEIPKALEHLGNGLVTAGARLTELDLSDNAFGPIGVQGLAALLRSPSCYNLKELRLNNNGLGITGGKLLANALMDCYNYSKEKGTPLALRVFIAGRNRLENEGAKALAKVFETVKTLEEISMPQNGIYHIGITALSEAFAKNPNLQILNLNDNTLGPKGSRVLANSLESLQELRSINLGDCLLKTKGAMFIAQAIDNAHTRLEELICDSNEIRGIGGVALAQAVISKPNLNRLVLGGNEFGKIGRDEIRKMLDDAGCLNVLDDLEDDESDSGGVEEDESDEEEEVEVEETDSEASDVEDVPVPVKTVTVKEFLDSPSSDNFLALDEDRTAELIAEAKSNPDDDTFLDTFVPVLMKVSALVASNQPEVVTAALETSDALFKEVFAWAQQTQLHAKLNNALLVHLGLIKSEDKLKPKWDTEGCVFALEAALHQNYVHPSTKDTLKAFIDRCKDSVASSKLNKTLNSLQ